jgi:hypothetical protein
VCLLMRLVWPQPLGIVGCAVVLHTTILKRCIYRVRYQRKQVLHSTRVLTGTCCWYRHLQEGSTHRHFHEGLTHRHLQEG